MVEGLAGTACSRALLLFLLLPARANGGGGSLRPGIFLGGLIGLPGLELLEQRLAVGLGPRAVRSLRVLVHEVVELRPCHRRDAVLVEPLLGRRQTIPSG